MHKNKKKVAVVEDPRINKELSAKKLEKIKGKPYVKKEPKTDADKIRVATSDMRNQRKNRARRFAALADFHARMTTPARHKEWWENR